MLSELSTMRDQNAAARRASRLPPFPAALLCSPPAVAPESAPGDSAAVGRQQAQAQLLIGPGAGTAADDEAVAAAGGSGEPKADDEEQRAVAADASLEACLRAFRPRWASVPPGGALSVLDTGPLRVLPHIAEALAQLPPLAKSVVEELRAIEVGGVRYTLGR